MLLWIFYQESVYEDHISLKAQFTSKEKAQEYLLTHPIKKLGSFYYRSVQYKVYSLSEEGVLEEIEGESLEDKELEEVTEKNRLRHEFEKVHLKLNQPSQG